jgi:hypothetical protein
MTYDQQLLEILTGVGERGISIRSLAMHLYNMNTSLFVQPDYEVLRSYVRQYVSRNSRTPRSLLEGTGRRGYYRLNTGGSADARQLMLHFHEEHQEEGEEEQPPQQDFSLDLFDTLV